MKQLFSAFSFRPTLKALVHIDFYSELETSSLIYFQVTQFSFYQNYRPPSYRDPQPLLNVSQPKMYSVTSSFSTCAISLYVCV